MTDGNGRPPVFWLNIEEDEAIPLEEAEQRQQETLFYGTALMVSDI